MDEVATRQPTGAAPRRESDPARARLLGRLAPHRQIWLLGAVSALLAALIVATALNVLVPTRRVLDRARRELVPPVLALNEAEESRTESSGVLPRAVSPDPAVRTAALSELTALNARSDAAWNRYRRLSANLPGERALQRAYEQHRRDALDAGSAFVVSPNPTQADIGVLTQASARLTQDIHRIKDLYYERTDEVLSGAESDVGSAPRDLLLIGVPSIVALLVAFGLAARSARLREERMVCLDAMLRTDNERNEMDARLQRAFEMVHQEPAAYDLVRRALVACEPAITAELIVADSSRAHFQQTTSTDANGAPGCPVPTPADCPAASWGQTQLWPSSLALDACPYLAGRPGDPCSAVCVPISIGGTASAVVHATSSVESPASEETIGRVTLIARKLGERVGMLRAFAKSETQALTDPLTGLMNRRSLEAKVRALVDAGHSYAIAYGDLDHFKQLNDVHGHDAGDQALRLFARVMRDAVRPEDLTARWGGEEFVVVLPDCSVGDAYTVINRLRERLERVHAGSHLPRFTVSFGLTASRPEDTFSQSLELADGALLKAKAAGRNRVVIAGDSDVRAPSTPGTKAPAAATTTRSTTNGS